MNFVTKQWEKFKSKSIWGKASDILFIVLIIVMLNKDGRIFLQQMILNTGLFGNIEKNENSPISDENWHWSLIDETGKKVQLADFKGQKLFINTWATWCPPCNAEMPYIIDLMVLAPETKFLFVTNENPEKVINHLDKKDWRIPVFYNLQQPVNELEYKSLPTTFIIDENGVLIHKSAGMKKWNNQNVIDLLNS